MIKLVIIDFDDTLCLTETACFELENEAAKRMGFDPMSREVHLKNWGKPVEQAITERIPGIDAKEFMKQLEYVHEEFIRDGRVDVITEDNLQFLDDIKASGRRLAIVTSRSLQEVKHLLEKDHPLNIRIEKFYHKDNSPYLKPDPRVFDQVLEDFSVKPEEAVYLGDTLGDAVSATKAGLHFIAVLESGLKTRDDFQSVNVNFFATTLPEALQYIFENR